jgi:alkanesulfonate monooxygenase SsuD/methylene tetrahydromethanopterin reductase-like flavin-dependent oxidoreductase (luciferase family)
VKLGLFGINMGAASTPESLASTAQMAEGGGVRVVLGGEHVALPDPQVPPSPMAPQDPALDPLLALAWAASCTRQLRLATGIIILPQRNPGRAGEGRSRASTC